MDALGRCSVTAPLVLTPSAWEILTGIARWHSTHEHPRRLVTVPHYRDSWAANLAWRYLPSDPEAAWAAYGWKWWGTVHGEDYLSPIGAPEVGACPCGAPLSREQGARPARHPHPSGLPVCGGCRDECGFVEDEWRCAGT